ncbi:hypothetical protein QBC35DRAFT_488738 [Podospora australis]|uniref:Zn(2)-C6 fungal-type domain-containing protein n=1 Tax=Podospora australis TaxID=1536484 RepID=A0AAN7ALZ0_9PEZI|nr:hypothetical protein QBC35DRAFT_488738 [Podospora australis]
MVAPGFFSLDDQGWALSIPEGLDPVSGLGSDSAPTETTYAETTPAASTDAGSTTTKVRRRPIPRKGHTKSRRGCFSCKRRKVKCQENLPECLNCTKMGLSCKYPERPQQSDSSSPGTEDSLLSTVKMPSPVSLQTLQATPTTFTPNDMRFFHHFLITAYPPLPMQGDDIWRQVATLSHKYDYLMHAMLGLAASNLALYGGNYGSQALAHRVKAIQLLSQELTKPCTSTAEGDARYGTTMALAFQSSCMPEGMTEFLSMTRGCHIVANSSMLVFEDSLFGGFNAEGYPDSIRRLIGTGPLILAPEQEAFLDEFLISLRALGPLCKSPLEVQFLASTELIVKTARISASEAFARFADQYNLTHRASLEEFNAFTDANNYPAQLLLIHFYLIEFAIGWIALRENGLRFAFRRRVCISWMENLAAGLPEKYQKFAEWPMNYARQLAAMTF